MGFKACSCGDSRHGDSGGFRHEWNGAGTPGIDLKHPHDLPLDGELDVVTPTYPEFQADSFGQLLDLPNHVVRQCLGRDEARRITRVDPGFLQMLHDCTDVHLGPITCASTSTSMACPRYSSTSKGRSLVIHASSR